ncbi:hypothetical protein EIN_262330, partial [Entamoeba invadens IP1]
MIRLFFIFALIVLAFSNCPLNEIEGTEYVLTANDVCEYAESLTITSSKLQMTTGSTLKTEKNLELSEGYITLESNCVLNITELLKMNYESMCNATGNSIINTNQLEISSSTINLTDTSIVKTNQLEISSSTINLSGNSMLSSVGNVNIVISLFKLSENALFSVQGNVTLSGSTSPNTLSGKSKLVCLNMFSKTVGSQISINENSHVELLGSFIFKLSRNNLQMSSSTQRINFVSKSFELTREFDADNRSTIQTKNLILTLTSTFKVSTDRTIKDLPLFFVSNTTSITGFSGFTHDCDFDFLYTNNTLDTTSYTTPFKVLLDGHLLRYGTSDKIYCHVNHTEDTLYPYYIENYCPLTDAYITPIDTFYQMKVKVDAPKQNSNVKNAENEVNVIVIGNEKYDLSLTDFIEIEMVSDNQIDLDNFTITKNVFLVAANGFEYNNTSCKSGYFQNGIFICQNHIPCSEGGKTAEGKCAACQDVNCVMCDGDKGNCIKCKENMTYNTNTNICEEYTNCLSFTKDKCLRCNDGFVFEGNNCVNITEDNGNCQIKVGVPSECR